MERSRGARRHRLTRRQLFALGGGVAAAALVGCSPLASPGAAPGPPPGPLLRFTIGLHIEPFGTTAQGFRSGAIGGRQLDYADRTFFDRQVEDIRAVAAVVERHGGRMTVQGQSPFTPAVLERGHGVLRELAAAGHEIALHFHEDAHLGPRWQAEPVERWAAVFEEELALLRRAAGIARVRSWSGGNTYPRLYEAAARAGLQVNSDWKDPARQATPLALTGVHPWRPAGGTDGTEFGAFARHDPAGPVVFLPEGAYDREDFAAMRRATEFGGDAAYFAYLGERLRAAVALGRADRVNVHHITIHPGEFRGSGAAPFGVIERFLAETVDPLVASGEVAWATFTEMADAYLAWEGAHPGAAPK